MLHADVIGARLAELAYESDVGRRTLACTEGPLNLLADFRQYQQSQISEPTSGLFGHSLRLYVRCTRILPPAWLSSRLCRS
jgi:hypothetical protein